MRTGHGFPGAALVQPLVIPFTGEYWLFRAPFLRPPFTSLSEQGSPLRLSFMTTDQKPLAMEAYQGLDDPIHLACCSKVQLALVNADRSGMVSLELILVDSRRRGAIELLGFAPVGLQNHPILDFPIPASPSLDEFDGIKVIYRRDPVGENRSAKIEIDRFVLIPAAGPS